MAAELKQAEPGLEVELYKSSGGVFEVTYNGDLIYSKKELGRFPEFGEVVSRLKK